MTHALSLQAYRLGKQFLAGLALAGSIAVAAGGAPVAHAAGTGIICLPSICPPAPTLTMSAPQYSDDGTATVTFTGQGYTPGGQVEIDGHFLGSIVFIATTTASTALVFCNPILHTCRQLIAGGAISVSVTLPPRMPCGLEAPYVAQDVQTKWWSNAVSC